MRNLILLCGVLGFASVVSAQGKMGPSARAAARLKKTPPPTWIRHYLPDDRYKIAGKVWKFVSTEIDRSYHMPDSNFMLRQSPNRVIGFSSFEEAEDAGYKPASDLPKAVIQAIRAKKELKKKQEEERSAAIARSAAHLDLSNTPEAALARELVKQQ